MPRVVSRYTARSTRRPISASSSSTSRIDGKRRLGVSAQWWSYAPPPLLESGERPFFRKSSRSSRKAKFANESSTPPADARHLFEQPAGVPHGLERDVQHDHVVLPVAVAGQAQVQVVVDHVDPVLDGLEEQPLADLHAGEGAVGVPSAQLQQHAAVAAAQVQNGGVARNHLQQPAVGIPERLDALGTGLLEEGVHERAVHRDLGLEQESVVAGVAGDLRVRHRPAQPRERVDDLAGSAHGRNSQSVEKLAKSQWQVAGSSFARRSASVRPKSSRSMAVLMVM